MGKTGPKLEWQPGTAYDYFTSLYVLYRPEEFGLRASWAAGVRSRLSEETRRFMADAQHFAGVPGHWLYSLPEPRDSKLAIQALERMGPVEIAKMLVFQPCPDDPAKETALREIMTGGHWSNDQRELLLHGAKERGKPAAKDSDHGRMGRWLDWVANPAEMGRLFLKGMTEFRESFFREEERRIAPAVERALQEAQAKAGRMEAADLVEELTRGLRVTALVDLPRLVLVPCYWCSPRVMYGDLAPGFRYLLFGARPQDASVIPEDEVPASLGLAMTALSDPTRLNILRLLMKEALTQAEIARKLRLRPSTISHHLKALRMAALISYHDSEGTELRYATRAAGVRDVTEALDRFLAG